MMISRQELAFKRGRAAYKAGERRENVWTDAEWECSFRDLIDGQWEWLGYMVERGHAIIKAERLREWAEEGGPLP
jgi:hypothetical protein